MISDEDLKRVLKMDEWDTNIICEMAQELLHRRKSEQLISDLEFVDDSCIFYAHSPERLAELLADDQLADNEAMATGVAIKHPGKDMRVWLTGGKDREVHWEWV